MGYSVEELIKEAKVLDNKMASSTEKDQMELDEIEKLASTLETYLVQEAPDYYKEAMEKAASASKENIMKVASFCKVAIDKGYSEQEIIEQLEKTAFRGIAPALGKVVKTVVGAPLKGAKTLAFGTETARAAAKERKLVQSAANKISKGRKQRYITAKVSRGSKPTSGGIKTIENKALRQAKAQKETAVRSKVLSGRKAIGKKPMSQAHWSKKYIKPAALVAGGAATGVVAHKEYKRRQVQRQPQVQYGY